MPSKKKGGKYAIEIRGNMASKGKYATEIGKLFGIIIIIRVEHGIVALQAQQ